MNFCVSGSPKLRSATRDGRRRHPTAVTALALVALFLSATTSARAQNSPPTFEFLVTGKPIEARDPPLKPDLLKKYRAALAAIPDADHCLISHGGEIVERRADWSRIRSTEELEVCLFWIAAGLGDPAIMQRWLSENGFRTGDPIVVEQSVMQKQGAAEAGTGVGADLAGHDIPKSMLPWGSWLFPPRGLSVSITFDASGRPIHTQASFLYK